MTKIIAVSNQKGGVGKTTTAVNLSAALADSAKRVLLVDLDPQGNATMGLGIDKTRLTNSITDVLLGDCSWQQILLTSASGADLLPGNDSLTRAEVALLSEQDREQRLKRALVGVGHDFVIIDCPPSLNMLTVNAMVAADSVLIPMQCEYYALEGLADLLNTIEQVQQQANPHLVVEGILRTMFDGRNRLATDVSRQLIAHFGNTVYRTVIPRNVRLAEAPSHGMSVIEYDRHSTGAAAYTVLAGEVIGRQARQES